MADQKQVAFLTAYESCHEAFVRYCSALAYGKMDSRDLVQDCLLSAYQNFENIVDKDRLLHYLIRTARNRSISIWRKSKFKTELIELHDQRLLSQDVSPDTLLEIQMLYRSIDKLPKRQKDSLVLFEISGFTMKEIAKIKNSTEGAVKTNVSRARRNLATLIKDHNFSVSDILKTIKTIAL